MSSTTPTQPSPSHPPDDQEPRPALWSVVVCIWRVVSSTWLGVSLLLALAAGYGILSIVEQLPAPKSMLPSVGSIYSHWTVVTLTFALCVNLLFATSRIPVRWDRAGAWCSHLGLMFLAVGSVVFWRTRIEGNCFIPLGRDGHWPTVRHFFQSTDKVVCHVSGTPLMAFQSPPATIQTVFDSPTGVDPVDIDVTVKGAPEGVSIRATRIYPRVEFGDQWLNDAVHVTPAVELLLSYGRETVPVTMCQSYGGDRRLGVLDCIVEFQAREAMSQEKIDEINAATPPTTQPSREEFTIHYTGSGQPVLVTRDASGKLQRREFTPGQSVSTAHRDHPLRIRLIRTMDHARRGISLKVPSKTVFDLMPAAIELTIQSGSWKTRRTVPYDPYLSSPATTIRLPSGRSFYVAFSSSWEKLPDSIRITRHEFKTAPASRMPEDYICDMEIGSGVQIRKETLKLNFPVSVGRFRIHQSTWRPKEETPLDYNDPSAIILGVADRPGILLIFVGSIAVCLGFPYAFYVKPLILKSRAGRAS